MMMGGFTCIDLGVGDGKAILNYFMLLILFYLFSRLLNLLLFKL
jgi:hypothetical protein